MQRYKDSVTEMQGEAASKFGANHGYNTSLLVGAKSVWSGKTCLELLTDTVNYTNENTRITLQRGDIAQATSNALQSCESRGYGSCIPLLINDKCVLEGPPPESPSARTKPNPESTPVPSGINLTIAKEKCADLGFMAGTEEFGRCALKLLK